MRSSGIRSVRLPLYWSQVQPENRFVEPPEFGGFDREVKLAAEEGIRVFPFLLRTPEWVSPEPRTLPVSTAWQRWAWSAFVRDAADRYGPDGSFWRENPEIPYLPIREWEIWNEENIVTFTRPVSPTAYAKLLRLSGRVLHEVDPGAKVIVGGLFGRPLQVPPNIPSGLFLSRLYRSRPIKRYFDGVGLHPYVAAAAAIPGEIRNLRRIMAIHHDRRTDIYVTELGWGSASHQSRWERGLRGQARELNQAMAMLVANRRAWRIGGVWWFSWRDLRGNCQFCDSAGLLTEDREAKPAWYQFNAWTGGDPDTVPRANFGG
jgi:polysaccharide biosynthesis protein PslG